jgi:hypothetical protein
MTFPIKWFSSTMAGAPTLSGTAGALISVLDACLQNGFNSTVATSLTYNNETKLCTFTTQTAHGYLAEQIVTISGANETGYNGEVRVVAINTNYFTYTPLSTPSITTATGTISAITTPAWGAGAKKYSGTNKAVYSPLDILSNGWCFRVDDNYTIYGFTLIYETMSDVDTGTGRTFPIGYHSNYASNAGAYFKSNVASTASRNWYIVADSRFIYIGIDINNNSAYRLDSHGEIYSFVPNDLFCAIHTCSGDGNSLYSGYTIPNYNAYGNSSNGGVCQTFFQRSYTAIPNQTVTLGFMCSPNYVNGYGLTTYPVASFGGTIFIKDILIWETVGTTNTFRGKFPGLYALCQSNVLSHLTIVNQDNKKILIVNSANGTTNNNTRHAFDISGPWR